MKTLVAIAALALAGCASPEVNTAANESPSTREYPTGSNIPRKGQSKTEGVRVYGPDALERVQNSTISTHRGQGTP